MVCNILYVKAKYIEDVDYPLFMNQVISELKEVIKPARFCASILISPK